MHRRKHSPRRWRHSEYRPYTLSLATNGPRDVCPQASKQAQPEQGSLREGQAAAPVWVWGAHFTSTRRNEEVVAPAPIAGPWPH